MPITYVTCYDKYAPLNSAGSAIKFDSPPTSAFDFDTASGEGGGIEGKLRFRNKRKLYLWSRPLSNDISYTSFTASQREPVIGADVPGGAGGAADVGADETSPQPQPELRPDPDLPMPGMVCCNIKINGAEYFSSAQYNAWTDPIEIILSDGDVYLELYSASTHPGPPPDPAIRWHSYVLCVDDKPVDSILIFATDCRYTYDGSNFKVATGPCDIATVKNYGYAFPDKLLPTFETYNFYYGSTTDKLVNTIGYSDSDEAPYITTGTLAFDHLIFLHSIDKSKTVDATSLPGWYSLSAGDHAMTIKAKSTAYPSSEPSDFVVVHKD